MSLSSVIRDERTNALLGWSLTGAVALAAVVDLLSGAVVWGAFWLLAVVAVGFPAVLTGDWTVIVPWPLPLCAVAAAALQVADVYAEIAGYLAVVTAALVVVVELDAFTPIEMSRRFTVGFAAMTTMAFQAWWAVAQFLSDQWLGSDYLSSETELQWDIVAVTGVALVVGGFFVWYFDRFDHAGATERPIVPDESP